MVAQSNRQSQAVEARKRAMPSHRATLQLYDPASYFFHKFGSCFNQLQAPLTKAGGASAGYETLDVFDHSSIEVSLSVKWLKGSQ
jgi:hypothetical protein